MRELRKETETILVPVGFRKPIDFTIRNERTPKGDGNKFGYTSEQINGFEIRNERTLKGDGNFLHILFCCFHYQDKK